MKDVPFDEAFKVKTQSAYKVPPKESPRKREGTPFVLMDSRHPSMHSDMYLKKSES